MLVVSPTEFTEATESPVTYTEVEITLENWQKYFEITIEERWYKNAFGEADGFSHYLVFRLKNAYADKVFETMDSAVDVEIGCDHTNYEWAVDFENQTYTIGTLSEQWLGEYETKIIDVSYPTFSANIHGSSRYKDGTGSCVSSEYVSVEVLRIQGALFLKNT